MADRPRRTRRTDAAWFGSGPVGSTFGSAPSAPRTSPFVLVPGNGVSSNYFERLAPNLNEHGPVHALIGPVVNAAERRVPLQARRFSSARCGSRAG
jgi:hypothetical protein